MKIEFINKEQDYQNDQTRYWFDVDGVEYCIQDEIGGLSLLDHTGNEVLDCNDFDGIKAKLMPEYEKHIND